jgi:molecular chaperone HscB
VNAHNNTAMPAAFLMQQMEWREALDDAASPHALEHLRQEVAQRRTLLVQQFGPLLDESRDYGAAVGLVRSLMFIEKFERDLDQRLEALEG